MDGGELSADFFTLLRRADDKRNFCAIVSLLRSSSSFLNREAKQDATGCWFSSDLPQRQTRFFGTLSARRLLQSSVQIRQKPVAQTAKLCYSLGLGW